MSAEDFRVITTMKICGGDFVQALAEAASRADASNLQRIKDAWADYWQRYAGMARRLVWDL